MEVWEGVRRPTEAIAYAQQEVLEAWAHSQWELADYKAEAKQRTGREGPLWHAHLNTKLWGARKGFSWSLAGELCLLPRKRWSLDPSPFECDLVWKKDTADAIA